MALTAHSAQDWTHTLYKAVVALPTAPLVSRIKANGLCLEFCESRCPIV